MKFELLKGELSVLLENLTEQFDTMGEHTHTIPQIEIDLFKRNIQKLYENALYLDRANTKQKHAKSPMLEEVNNVAEPIPTKVVAPIDVEETIDLLFNKEENKEAKEEISTAIESKKAEEVIVENEASPTEETVKAIKTNDLFESEAVVITDLNEKLAVARGNHSVAEKLQNKRIESLKSVIGINDKFQFINELFNGDAQKYDETIYTLNNFKKFDEAMQYFSTLKYRFSWEEESEAYEKLSLMLERKFKLTHA